MNVFFEAMQQILNEGYKEAQVEFVQATSDPELVETTITAYRDLLSRNQLKGEHRNIDWWRARGWVVFSKFVADQSLTKSVTQIKRNKVMGKAVIVEETTDWLVVIPVDKNASCYHGTHTDWCTTKPFNNYFEQYFYKLNVTLMYFLKITTGQKWAIAYYSDLPNVPAAKLPPDMMECFDQRDNKISQVEFKQQTGYDPVEYRRFIKQEDTANLIKSQRRTYIEALHFLQDHQPFTEKSTEVEQSLHLVKDINMIYQYLVATGREQSLERLLLAAGIDLFLQYLVTIGFVGKHEPLERAILRAVADKPPTKNWVELYASLILNKRWLEGEPTITSNPELAFQYAVRVVEHRWPEGEAAIATVPALAAQYARQFVDGRWEAAEQAILNDSTTAIGYVINNMKQRYPSIEPKLLNPFNPLAAIRYASQFFKTDGWPELEQQILEHAHLHIGRYASMVLHHRWSAGEQVLLSKTDPTAAIAYAGLILKGKGWPELEQKLDSGGAARLKYDKEVFGR